jgi:S-adenosylmethionine:tRNA ribosyltransferase-isomerase
MSALAEQLLEPLEAHEPPEARGVERDRVRMLVARADGAIEHARALDLPRFLDRGDLLVVNTSRTIPASLPALRPDGTRLDLHLSTPVRAGDANLWLAELRRAGGRFRDGRAGERLALPAGATARLLARDAARERFWVCELHLPEPLPAYLERHGRPIRYRHSRGDWPLDAYQTAFALVPGSAEMPSAGRPLSPALVTALVAHGVLVAPIVLHAGVSSLERAERPYPERFRVSAETARLVSATRAWGGRVVAVGTTVVRALETVARPDGSVEAGEGWTDLVVTPERGVRAVDGLFTGWHDADSSHLLMLEAIAGRELVARAYAAAVAAGYLWHEFGDAHLLLT